MKNHPHTFPLPKPVALLLQALAFALLKTLAFVVGVASRYPKASALGLSEPHKQWGFSLWGMLSFISHNFQWVKAQ
jgi:hypothetical protein